MKSVMVIKLRVEEPKPTFDPAFRDCRDIILRCFSEIIESAGGLPRVSESKVIWFMATLYQEILVLLKCENDQEIYLNLSSRKAKFDLLVFHLYT